MKRPWKYSVTCAIVSAISGTILITEAIGWRERRLVVPLIGNLDRDSISLLGWLLGGFLYGAFGFAVPGKMPSAWLALGLAAGAGLGFLIPTADVEHIDFHGERRDCLVHMVGLGIIGAFVGAGISGAPPKCAARKESSFSNSLLRVLASVVLCAPPIVLLIIRIFRPTNH